MSRIQTFMSGLFNLITIWWNAIFNGNLPLEVRMSYSVPFLLMIVGLITLVVGNHSVSGGKTDL